MSHFTVLVIGQDPEKQLAPFHEFECTGTNDRYVQDLDETEEKRTEYANDTMSMVQIPEGTLMNGEQQKEVVIHPVHGALIRKWSNLFQVPNPEYKPGDIMSNRTVHNIPDGYVELEIPTPEIMTLREHLCDYHGMSEANEDTPIDIEGDHKYGYVLTEGGEVTKVVRRTNPNRKWDWHQLGGRWSGFFKMKPRTNGITGKPGLMTSGAPEGTADQAFKLDIDFDGMRVDAEVKAAEQYDRAAAILALHPQVADWVTLRAKYLGETPELPGGINAARDVYHAQAGVLAYKEATRSWEGPDEFLVDRETYIRLSGLKSASTFAILKDGVWHERGSMGWWGMVADEKDDNTWLTELGKLLDGLPDETLLSVYDCHI
jgi:hypothetical protein